jgi:hypothetical protein
MNEQTTIEQIQQAYTQGLVEEAQLTERLEAIRKARPMQLGAIQGIEEHLKAEAAKTKQSSVAK